MAVSGRIVPATADFDHSCEPCLKAGECIEAHGFCVDCGEYLCKSCYSYHKRTKASDSHQLLDKDNLNKDTANAKLTNVDSIKCSIHEKEEIKFFCPVHEELVCSVCIIMNHRMCDIHYITDKCADIGDSPEYKGTMWLLNQKLKEIDAIMEKATVRDKEIDICHDNLNKEIIQIRKAINDHLDRVQLQIQTAADKKKSADKSIVQNVLETCTRASTDISKLQSSLQDQKTSQQNEKLYIIMKQAKSKLKSNEIQKSKEDLERTNIQYELKRSKDMETVLCEQDIFGMLNFPLTRHKLTPKGTISLKAESKWFFSDCLITGCGVLSSNEIMLADYSNKKLKVVDLEKEAVTEEITLESAPFDLTALPQHQIAVTIPEKQEILKLSSDRQLSSAVRIPVSGRCKGITYCQDYLYVVCQNPNCVLVLDTEGNVQHTISPNEEILKSPDYIALEENSNLVYINDTARDRLVSMTFQGDASARVHKSRLFKQEAMLAKTMGINPEFRFQPKGIIMLNDGSLLVCSCPKPGYILQDESGSIYHISGDLKDGEKIMLAFRYSTSICYNHHENEVYICGRHVGVYSLH